MSRTKSPSLFISIFGLSSILIITLSVIFISKRFVPQPPPKSVTSTEAVALVEKLPSVTKFLSSNSAAVIALEASETGENSWTVHVYENHPDYNATFGWYSVDKLTGNIKDILLDQMLPSP